MRTKDKITVQNKLYIKHGFAYKLIWWAFCV